MRFPRYPKYKASGIEWLGDVPEEWAVSCLKHSVNEIYSGGTPDTGNPEYWAVDEQDSIPWVAISDMTRASSVERTEKQITRAGVASKRLRVLPKGTLLYSMYASLGKVAVLAKPATINQAILGIIPDSKKHTQDFLRYWLIQIERHLSLFSSSNTQDNLNAGKVRILPLLVPNIEEQKQITDFLDRETAKIDELVLEQQRLMELLKEKRQAVISHAVTKGLKPHAPMKPSGIEWLGDMPAGWTLKRLQNVCNFQSGKAHEPFICDDGIYMCVTSRFVSTEGMKCKMCSENISPARRNDTLMVMSDLPNGRALAKAYFVGDERAYAVNQRVCILRPFSVAPKFLYYLLDRNPEFLQHDDGINQTHLSNSEFLKPQFPFPPHDEQVSIAQFLDAELAKFGTLTAEAQRAIDLLQERRTALISAAVTGQIDVRQQP
jgi:type I restriction enzyme S subunit